MASDKSKASEAEKSRKSANSKRSLKKTFPPQTAFKSQEFVHDSASDEEGNQADKTRDESDEGSEGGVQSSSAGLAKVASKYNGKLPPPSRSSDGSGDEDEEDDGDEDEEDDGDEEEPSLAAVEPTKQSAKEPTQQTASFKPPPPFKAPAGFIPATVDEASSASQMLKNSNLAGKQIWYFTAPASVPISSLKEMSFSDATKGKPVLSYKDSDYGFVDSAEDKTYTKIMVPSSSDDSYKYASKPIDRILHLHQIVRNPTTESSSRATVPAKKPIRQQPRGLQMRFRPVGFGSGEIGRIGSATPEPDVEMSEGTPLTFRRIPGVSDFDGSDEEMQDAPPVPEKSHSKSKSSKSEKESFLKRKHKTGGEKKSKHSSSSTSITTERKELKRSKKK